MRHFMYILSFLILTFGFASCEKSETAGFDQAEISFDKSAYLDSENIENEHEKVNESLGIDENGLDGNDENQITDDEDDEDEDENNPSSNR